MSTEPTGVHLQTNLMDVSGQDKTYIAEKLRGAAVMYGPAVVLDLFEGTSVLLTALLGRLPDPQGSRAASILRQIMAVGALADDTPAPAGAKWAQAAHAGRAPELPIHREAALHQVGEDGSGPLVLGARLFTILLLDDPIIVLIALHDYLLTIFASAVLAHEIVWQREPLAMTKIAVVSDQS